MVAEGTVPQVLGNNVPLVLSTTVPHGLEHFCQDLLVNLKGLYVLRILLQCPVDYRVHRNLES
jgi:hypothetical protein